MAKGRKRIPSKILEITGGTLRTHRPAPKNEPDPPAKMPPCPKHLDKEAKKEWKRSGKILQTIGLMTELDMMILAAYCEAYSRWTQATIKIQETGMVYQKKDGSPGFNPYLRIARDAYDQMIKAGVQIGMSPSSRSGLKVETPKPKSKIQEFKDRKKG